MYWAYDEIELPSLLRVNQQLETLTQNQVNHKSLPSIGHNSVELGEDMQNLAYSAKTTNIPLQSNLCYSTKTPSLDINHLYAEVTCISEDQYENHDSCPHQISHQ